MGLIDVGHSSADSVNIWSHAKDRKKMLKVLSESTVVKGSDNKSESVAFGPKAVASAGSSAESQGSEYLKTVGKGLAYIYFMNFGTQLQGSSHHW